MSSDDLFNKIIELKSRYTDYQYGINPLENITDDDWEYLKDHKNSVIFNENILLTKEEYDRRIQSAMLRAKIDLFDEILTLSDNTCISGCNIKMDSK